MPAERLQEVVEGVNLEGADRVLIVDRDKHYTARNVGPERFQHPEPVLVGHLDIQKHQVRTQLPHTLDRLVAVGGFADHGDAGAFC